MGSGLLEPSPAVKEPSATSSSCARFFLGDDTCSLSRMSSFYIARVCVGRGISSGVLILRCRVAGVFVVVGRSAVFALPRLFRDSGLLKFPSRGGGLGVLLGDCSGGIRHVVRVVGHDVGDFR